MFYFKKIAHFLLLFLLFTKLFAEENLQIDDSNTTKIQSDKKPVVSETVNQFIFENDFISGTDAHYTNGLYYSWLNDENIFLPSFLDLDSPKKSKAITISHIVFTPEDIDTTEPISTDTPYAGYLGVTYNLYQYSTNYFHEIGATIGMVGEYTYAMEAQRAIHRATGNKIPKGWDNQLGTHIMTGLSYQYARKTDNLDLKLFQVNLSGYGKFTLGEQYTGSRVGLQVSIGNRLGDTFHTSGNFLGGLESCMLNYKTKKGFNWSLTYGGFYNRINYFYLVEASDYYEIESPNHIRGNFIAYNIGYNSLSLAVHVKTDHIDYYGVNGDALTLKYGGFIITWKY